ncbi:hypothetical protein AAIB33_16375 [Microbacterium sp. AZCO]|uniref:hypothetical protein n=1 Tax=Microbacterium sp. AZCO TaxID=3142976 RepID=UPI0031F4338B
MSRSFTNVVDLDSRRRASRHPSACDDAACAEGCINDETYCPYAKKIAGVDVRQIGIHHLEALILASAKEIQQRREGRQS